MTSIKKRVERIEGRLKKSLGEDRRPIIYLEDLSYEELVWADKEFEAGRDPYPDHQLLSRDPRLSADLDDMTIEELEAELASLRSKERDMDEMMDQELEAEVELLRSMD